MESHSKILGHPAHTILIVFPLGLLSTAVIFDVLFLITRSGAMAQTAYYMVGAGIVGGLVASPFGWWDWFFIPKGTRAKRVGLLHGVGNVIVLLLFALSWIMRRPSVTSPATLALIPSFAGFALAGLTGWLGGEMVDRLGVGVDDGANVNAPNSLTRTPGQFVNARVSSCREG